MFKRIIINLINRLRKKNNGLKVENVNIKRKKIYMFDLYIYIFYLVLLILILFVILKKFSYKSILLSYCILNLYILYFFLFYYPNERKKMIRYINKTLNDRKEEYILELENEKKINDTKEIKELILKDDENYDIKSFELKEKVSMLIGKKSENNFVDIDFDNHEYSYLVSRVHGILNKVGNNWFYEDLNSKNGSGIEKNNGKKEKIVPNTPYKIEIGDYLYIGVIKILIN